MKTFNMAKYEYKLPNQSSNSNTEVKEGEEGKPDTPKRKEIQISTMDGMSASEVVARMLMSSLEREDLNLIHPDDSGDNDILKHVKVISAKDVKENLDDSIEFVKEAHLVVLDFKEGDSLEEKVFLNHLTNNNKKVSIMDNEDNVEVIKDIHDFSLLEPVQDLEGTENNTVDPTNEIVDDVEVLSEEIPRVLSTESEQEIHIETKETNSEEDMFDNAFGTGPEREPVLNKPKPVAKEITVGGLYIYNDVQHTVMYVDPSVILIKGPDRSYTIVNR